MGGAIGTQLLLAIFLLVIALVCTIIKRNERKSNESHEVPATTTRNDIHLEEISDWLQGTDDKSSI